MRSIEIEITEFEDNQEELSINLFGLASDEMDLLQQGIRKLINQIDLTYMCSGDRKLFEEQMKKVLSAVEDNINQNIPNYISTSYKLRSR